MPATKRKAGANTKTAGGKRARFGDVSIVTDAEEPTLPSAGRPKRASASSPQYAPPRRTRRSTNNEDTTPASPAAETLTPKKRGRPAKATAAKLETPPPPSVIVQKKRDLQAKSTTAITSKSNTSKKQAQDAKKTVNAPKSTNTSPKRTSNKNTSITKNRQDAETKYESKSGPSQEMDAESGAKDNADLTHPVEGIDQDIQYWLMKAEPESRIEKGHDVKFSIDDLAAKSEPEGWDGVRNPVARNHMRAMRAGDLAFFYHSNCKTPGVAGVMRIVGEHEVDESAFDPNHPYYDAKSDREKPKWELVRVEFVKKFSDLVTLKELRSYSLPGSALQNMVMLKQSRLSVSPVTPAEWTFILECAGEKPSLGHPAPRDGYETDVDGEGEAVTGVEETLQFNGDNTKDQALSQHNGHVVAGKRQIMEGTIALAGLTTLKKKMRTET
ncbi:hypothetical protein PV10_02349 [Exophiala mesophila]|uniref:Thymocyte nuclear protein 1 n=1 Tax=Exophiala mesophila TaxID=212818 RepID=A0A0D1ZJ34_EXOME|nr:uncharacterized protein PV10_02349 [Exophiala mesophila]KIV94597.1 hypothetical protein PV10_02349 [Exophiala mesophila]